MEGIKKPDGTITQGRELTTQEKADWILHKELEKKYPNYVGFDRGYKIKNGKETKTIALRVFVEKKVPASKLKKEELIPSILDGFPTDVIKTGKLKIKTQPKKNLVEKITSCIFSQSDYRKQRHRPFEAGISIGNWDINAGTAGYPFIRNGKLVLFTNAHVGCSNPRKDVSKQERRNLQPGAYDGGKKEENIFGRLISHILLEEDYPAFNDAAIIEPYNEDDLLVQLLNIGVIKGVTTVDVSDESHKSGRTTGLTDGTLLSLNATTKVDYGGYYITHLHCQLCTVMSDGGDSGSIMIKYVDGEPRVWGYLFAGSSTHTVCHEIQNMMKVFGLSLPQAPQPEPDLTIKIVMKKSGEKKYNVLFNAVTEGDNPLADVNISVGDKKGKTDVAGRFTAELNEGSYKAVCGKEGYITVEKEFVLPPT